MYAVSACDESQRVTPSRAGPEVRGGLVQPLLGATWLVNKSSTPQPSTLCDVSGVLSSRIRDSNPAIRYRSESRCATLSSHRSRSGSRRPPASLTTETLEESEGSRLE